MTNVNLDDMACFASLCRKAQAGTLTDADRDDLARWVARHGEGIVASIAEVERTLGEVHEVQRQDKETITTLVETSRALSRTGQVHENRIGRLESNLWGGPPPRADGDGPRG